MEWDTAPDITLRINNLVRTLEMENVNPDGIYCFRSHGSSSRAIARIWSLPRIWQKALNIPAGYCIEVVSEKFDRLVGDQQDRVLIHELLHIPKSFSGSLVPHRNSRDRSFRPYHNRVETLFAAFKSKMASRK